MLRMVIHCLHCASALMAALVYGTVLRALLAPAPLGDADSCSVNTALIPSLCLSFPLFACYVI